MKIDLLKKLREKNPLAYNICNFVTVQDVCNGISAIGASPAADVAEEELGEAEDLIKVCNSLTVNIGALINPKIDNIAKIINFANKYHKPVVLDPVAVGASNSRKKRTESLLKQNKIAVIRGNSGEIATLAGIKWTTKGIDAGEGSADRVEMAQKLAEKYHCVVAESGKTDIITDGKEVTKIFNQTDLFKLHIGSGDMLSSIIGCFCGIENNYFEAARVGALVFAIAGEIAANLVKKRLPGTFAAKLIDELYLINKEKIKKYAKFTS